MNHDHFIQLPRYRSAVRWPAVARFANFERVAIRKLQQLHAAADLDYLRIPPNNRLEALKGDRKGQYSIRINDQWRICFRFAGGHAADVEIVDYH